MSNPSDYTGLTNVKVDAQFAATSQSIARAATINALSSDKSVAVFASGSVNITVNGIDAGIDGQFLTLINLGAGTLTIANQNTNALAANRILTQASTTIVTTLAGSAQLVYIASQSRWVLTNLQA